MFASVCHFLNRIGFSWHVPEAVGYLGWIKLPYLGPIAFVGLDGHRQYRW
jgi:hypothetical protein